MSDPLIKTLFHRGVHEREAQAILSRAKRGKHKSRLWATLSDCDIPRVGVGHIEAMAWK